MMMDDASSGCQPRLAHTDDYLRYGRQMILDNFGVQGIFHYRLYSTEKAFRRS